MSRNPSLREVTTRLNVELSAERKTGPTSGAALEPPPDDGRAARLDCLSPSDIVEDAPAPTALPAEPDWLFGRILVAYDDSPQSAAALNLAARLARELTAAVAIVHVVEDPLAHYGGFAAPVSIVDERFRALRQADALVLKAADQLATSARAEGLAQVRRFVCEGPVVQTIVEVARDWAADVIVMGTHARRGLSHLVLGSTAEDVMRHAPCPVMTVSTPASGSDPRR